MGVETSARGRTPPPDAMPAGVFRAGVPSDSHGVMQLFAIAARTVCAAPDRLEAIEAQLAGVIAQLIAPEATAAAECMRLWRLFAGVAQLPKHSLQVEAGRAFCRDLDAVGQRLDLAPLEDWDRLPTSLDQPDAQATAPAAPTDGAVSLAAVRQAARHMARESARDSAAGAPAAASFPATAAAQLVATLNSLERRQLFEDMVGRGLLGRADVNLLARFLVRGGTPGAQDTTLLDVLRRLGAHLAADGG